MSLKIFLTAIILFPAFQSMAQPAETKPDPKANLCAFKRMTLFGASVTQGTMRRIGLNLLFPFVRDGGGTFDMGPASKLKWEYGNMRILRDFSVGFGDPTGAMQIEEMLNEDLEPNVKKSTAIVGVDAFYWDAVRDSCRGGWPQVMIPRLTEYAREKGIILFLGTVPYEDPHKVYWYNRYTWIEDKIGRQAWRQPVPHCVHMINTLVRRHCLAENQCYISDMESAVKTINNGGTLTLNDGRSFSRKQLRPDGVHLSAYGSEYMRDEMLNELAKNPPLCATKPPRRPALSGAAVPARQ